MSGFFSLDSKFMRAMSRIGDLLILNFFFLITCIPIITIGAAISALYTATFRFNTLREEGTTRTYFKAFKDNLKQATPVWLLILFIIACSLFNTMLFYVMYPPLHYLFILFAFIFVLAFMAFSYAFPLVSQFENKTIATLCNAIVFSLAYFPRTIIIVILNIFPFFLLFTNIMMFFHMGFLWVAFYFSTVAYLNTWLLRKVFQSYLPEEYQINEEDL